MLRLTKKTRVDKSNDLSTRGMLLRDVYCVTKLHTSLDVALPLLSTATTFQ
jgi:hypothetical protein